MATSDEDILSTEQAGRELGVSARQVLNMIADGVLPARQIGRAYLIRRADLAKVPTDRKPGPKPAAEPQKPAKAKRAKK